MHRSKRIIDTQHEHLFVSSVVYQTVRVSGVARTPSMLGHSMGTGCTFVQTSVQSAAAFRRVWGLLLQNFTASQAGSDAVL